MEKNTTRIPKIAPGFHVGKLTVEEPTDGRKNGYTIWRCRCDCGGIIMLDTRCLQRGTICDCGCETRVKPGQKDITGMRFGKLVAISPVEGGGSGETIWRCKCDCGGVVDAPLRKLMSGDRKSCGCLSRPPIKDLVGKRFGKLTVTEYAGKKDGVHMWRCRCDCGNETVVGQTSLQSGNTKSCGCMPAEALRDKLKLVDNTSVTLLEYHRSHPVSKNSSSGYRGVYLDKHSNKWTAHIGFKGKQYYLGSYGRLEEALRARREGEEMYDEFLEWYYSKYPERGKGRTENGNE